MGPLSRLPDMVDGFRPLQLRESTVLTMQVTMPVSIHSTCSHTQSELWSNSTAAIIKVPLNLQIEEYILIQSNGISVTEARAVPDYGLK